MAVCGSRRRRSIPTAARPQNVETWKDSGSLKPAQDREPEDSIAILQDSNGDGVMDKKHVFADKLELVTGFVFYRNGVIVASAPDIWYLEDTNGDEVADTRTKLYTGLGTFDTHAVINNLRWGLDGWIYATHGYSTGTVTTGDGGKTLGRANSGVVRFTPDGQKFEQYSSRGGNTWGLDITWDGQVFWTQPTSGTVFFHTVLPEYVLAQGRIPEHDLLQGHDRRAEDVSGDRPGRNRPTPRSIWSGSSRRRPAAPSTTAAPGPSGGATATSRPSRPSTWCITSS